MWNVCVQHVSSVYMYVGFVGRGMCMCEMCIYVVYTCM